MKILTVTLSKIANKALTEAVSILQKGGVVIYPTETAYALGADATNIRRSLFLCTQIIDLKIPVILVLNMIDLVEKSEEEIAKLAGTKKIKKVVFDKGGYAYHGKIKAIAEGAREGGLSF